MAYVNTGKQRSLTLQVIKTVNGNIIPGYENKIYDGKLAFTASGYPYPVITDQELAEMNQSLFERRLNAFCTYVESREPGLKIDEMTETGFEAIRTNTEVCPIGI